MVNRCAASAPHTPNPDYRPDRLASVIIREYQLSRRAISAIDGDDAAYHPENEFLAMFHRISRVPRARGITVTSAPSRR
jgi:hypothetical protein